MSIIKRTPKEKVKMIYEALDKFEKKEGNFSDANYTIGWIMGIVDYPVK